jgi:hypothetical protein
MRNFFKKIVGLEEKPFDVPYDYKKIIFTYAVGGHDFEPTVVMLHRKMLEQSPEAYKKTLEYEFLVEVDDALSDYITKAAAKRKLLLKYQKEAQNIIRGKI